MMSQLSWAALILAALAAVACWNHEDSPVSREGRPVFGAAACCARHKTTSMPDFISLADREAARRPRGGMADRP